MTEVGREEFLSSLIQVLHSKLTYLHFTDRTDIDRLIDQILLEEPLISEARKPQLKKLIEKLIEKQLENQEQRFGLFKVLRAHLLPLTNCAFNKSGSRFITGSYDRTCKVWDTNSGQELLSLDEHTNVVYTMAFNNPYG